MATRNVHFQPHQFVVLKWYENVCVCVCGQNELEVCATLAYPPISSFRPMPELYTSTRTLKPFEDSEPTGLKVDIAWQLQRYFSASEQAHCTLVVYDSE